MKKERKKENKIRKGDIEAYFNISIYIIPIIMVVIGVYKKLMNEVTATILLLVIVILAIVTFKTSIELYNIKKRIGDLNNIVNAKALTKENNKNIGEIYDYCKEKK